MKLSAFEIAVFTGVLSVGATLAGVFISYYLSVRLIRKQARMAAGAKLRAAFAPQMADYTLLGREIGRDLHMNLVDHAAAVEEYKIYVPRKNRIAYQQAWESYYKSLGLNKNGAHSGSYGDGKVSIEKIEEILKFE